jgi:hypothetical protein
MPAKDVSVRDSLLSDSVLQRAGYMILPDYVREFLGTVFSGENLISHDGNWSDYNVL